MSRPQKIHPPLKVDFNRALAAVGMGSGAGKKAALELQRNPKNPPPAKKPEVIIKLNEQRNRLWLVEVWANEERIYPTEPREIWDGTTMERAREEGIIAVKRHFGDTSFSEKENRFEG